jgi:hypothetical protein
MAYALGWRAEGKWPRAASVGGESE